MFRSDASMAAPFAHIKIGNGYHVPHLSDAPFAHEKMGNGYHVPHLGDMMKACMKDYFAAPVVCMDAGRNA